MLYFINGNNLKTIFGIDIVNSIPPFLQLPERKPSVQNDFKDKDGIQIDLEDPRFSARQFVFNCIMSGADINAIKNTYFGLFNLLKIKGTYSIYNDYVNLTVFGYYIKQQNLSQPFQNNEGNLSIRFDLTFGETDPFANIPTVFLVDDKNRFLVP